MSKQIELKILEAVLKRHLEEPLRFLCVEVSRECEARDLGYKTLFGLPLREEILSFLDGEETVESFVERSNEDETTCVSTDHTEVVAMRTHILETMIARRKES